MIKGFVAEDGRLRARDPLPDDLVGVVWIDMLAPERAEEERIEASLGINVPTRAEMAEIEISSRLYHDDGASFMTAVLPAHTDTPSPIVAPVTFVLAGGRLVTVRYHEPRAFATFEARAERIPGAGATGEQVMLGLLEVIIDRLADVLEKAAADIDGISREVFRDARPKPMTPEELRALVRALGRDGDLITKLRDSLASLERVLGFLGQITLERGSAKDNRARLKTLNRDVASLTAHADFLGQKITFLLEATLGLVNIEQNAIIKIVSVAAVVFLPPTLVASVYGMNFALMPELDWRFGYPLALGLMILSAVLPYWFFKRRGWL